MSAIRCCVWILRLGARRDFGGGCDLSEARMIDAVTEFRRFAGSGLRWRLRCCPTVCGALEDEAGAAVGFERACSSKLQRNANCPADWVKYGKSGLVNPQPLN